MSPGLSYCCHIPFDRVRGLHQRLHPKHRLQQPLRFLGSGHHLFQRPAFRDHQRKRRRPYGLHQLGEPHHSPRHQLVRDRLQHQRLGQPDPGQCHFGGLLLGPGHLEPRERRKSSLFIDGRQWGLQHQQLQRGPVFLPRRRDPGVRNDPGPSGIHGRKSHLQRGEHPVRKQQHLNRVLPDRLQHRGSCHDLSHPGRHDQPGLLAIHVASERRGFGAKRELHRHRALCQRRWGEPDFRHLGGGVCGKLLRHLYGRRL